MVVEGEEVQAAVHVERAEGGGQSTRVSASKADGTPVLSGTMSVGPDHGPTELDTRRAAQRGAGELFIIDRVTVGSRSDDTEPSVIDFESPNGNLYPFSLQRKLDTITENHPWYANGAETPWGRPVLPFEMLSVLTNMQGPRWPVRTPSLGLFLDLEVRMIAGPVFAERPYLVHGEVIGLSQSRRVESYWTRSTVVDPGTEAAVCEVVLHQGVFKDSYAAYPAAK